MHGENVSVTVYRFLDWAVTSRAFRRDGFVLNTQEVGIGFTFGGNEEAGIKASKRSMMRDTSACIASSHSWGGPNSPERASFAVRGSPLGDGEGMSWSERVPGEGGAEDEPRGCRRTVVSGAEEAGG